MEFSFFMVIDGDQITTLYSTRGVPELLMQFPYLYNFNGDWVGWITEDKKVFSVLGMYVGYISPDFRILRNRYTSEDISTQTPPPRPSKRILPPATLPLAPMMSELMYTTVDVLQEEPERLHTLDTGELRQDLD